MWRTRLSEPTSVDSTKRGIAGWGPASTEFLATDDLDRRQGEYEFAPSTQVPFFPLDYAISEMPWQNHHIVRIQGRCICLGDDRNPGSGCVAAVFVGVHLGDACNVFGREAAVLQQDVALGGRTVAHY